LPGVIIHAATVHHRQHVRHIIGGERAFAGEGVDAVIGECRAHQREIAGAQGERALAEIEVEHLLRIALQHARRQHHPGDGAVAVAGLLFGEVDGLVERQIAAGEAGEQGVEGGAAFRLVMPGDQFGGGDRAGIDHRVERAAVRHVQRHRIEAVARRLDPDLGEDGVAPMLLQRVAVDEGLGDRLDGEGMIRIANRMDRAVHGGDGDAEQGGIGLGEFGNIAGGGTVRQRGEGGVETGEEIVDRAVHACSLCQSTPRSS
jgi:hypothetical protein